MVGNERKLHVARVVAEYFMNFFVSFALIQVKKHLNGFNLAKFATLISNTRP